jgi:hypothetical protein
MVAFVRARGANEIADPRGATLFDLPYAVYVYAVGFSFGPSTAELHVDPRGAIMAAAPQVAVAGLVFGVLAVAGAVGLARRVRDGDPRRRTAAGSPAAGRGLTAAAGLTAVTLVVAWLVLPLVVAAVSAFATGNPFNPRYAIIAFPAFVLVLGCGADALAGLAPARPRTALAGALGAVALVSAASLRNLASDPRYAKEDCRGLGARLAREARPEDLVVVNAYYMASAVKYYYPGGATVVGYEEPVGPNARERIAADLRRLADGHPRVWLVLSRVFDDDRERLLVDTLGTFMTPDGVEDGFSGVRVARFARTDGAIAAGAR